MDIHLGRCLLFINKNKLDVSQKRLFCISQISISLPTDLNVWAFLIETCTLTSKRKKKRKHFWKSECRLVSIFDPKFTHWHTQGHKKREMPAQSGQGSRKAEREDPEALTWCSPWGSLVDGRTCGMRYERKGAYFFFFFTFLSARYTWPLFICLCLSSQGFLCGLINSLHAGSIMDGEVKLGLLGDMSSTTKVCEKKKEKEKLLPFTSPLDLGCLAIEREARKWPAWAGGQPSIGWLDAGVKLCPCVMCEKWLYVLYLRGVGASCLTCTHNNKAKQLADR